MAVATGNVVHSTEFDVPGDIELGPSQLCVIANGIATCTSVAVSHKNWKELKWELKENLKQEIDISIKSIVAEIPKLKDNEGDPWQRYAGDPEWLQAVKLIAERADQLQQEVMELRAFIRKEERPQLGEKALAASAPQQTVDQKKPPSKTTASPKNTKRKKK
jgi:hypothetical protein